MVLQEGFAWRGKSFNSLSQIAKAMTGTSWNGHRFFGLRQAKDTPRAVRGSRKTKAPGDATTGRLENHTGLASMSEAPP